jgi:hypothetical protein
MATRYPGAEWDPLSATQTQPRMARHDVVCVHTMAGTFAGTDGMFHENGYGGTESHFGLAGSGRLKQWQDLDFTADANYEGSDRVISIETADMGESFPAWGGSDVPPWTDRQIDVLVAGIGWLCDRYDIPKQLVANSSPGQRGIGYHRQGIDGNFTGPYRGRQGVGERWSKSGGKVCPGDRRIRQLIEIVIPRVRGEQEDPMAALTDDQQLELLRLARTIDKRLTDDGDVGRRSKEITIGVRALLARDGDVDEAEVARKLAPLVLAGMPVDEIAQAVVEALPDEQAQAFLDALAVRIAG